MAVSKGSKKGRHKKTWIFFGVVILVLALALFLFLSIGTFTTQLPPSPPCIGASGYYCQNAKYNQATGNIIVTLRQETGTNWTTANFVFVPQGTTTSNGIPSISFTSSPANTLYGTIGKGLPAGENILISLPVTGAVESNTIAFGSIWVAYTINQTNTLQYRYVATVYIKAS
jgi:hypothetical protein